MSLTDTVAGTVLGGFIAGIVGLLTTRYERSLRRKEAHMREHEKNFDVIQDSLLELKPLFWPLVATRMFPPLRKLWVSLAQNERHQNLDGRKSIY